ncbi:MAG: nucleotidyltransferase domain-containing protein [Candidatus Diapherotrites archaeon]|nr:nucleotidyltransferase domain-containing protein [Candidatus Diapherotrites archaeon]
MVRELTNVKIITVFMPELINEFNIRELAKKASISYDAAYRHIKVLVEKSILREKQVGKATVCSLNLNNIVARKYLENISISKTEEFLKKDVVLKKMFSELVENLKKAAPNELLCVVLFGSYARGEQKENSDVDILIISSTFDAREKLERECGGIEHRYGRDIASLITTASEFVKMLKSKKRMVAHEVQQDGIALYGFENYFSLLSEGVSND